MSLLPSPSRSRSALLFAALPLGVLLAACANATEGSDAGADRAAPATDARASDAHNADAIANDTGGTDFDAGNTDLDTGNTDLDVAVDDTGSPPPLDAAPTDAGMTTPDVPPVYVTHAFDFGACGWTDELPYYDRFRAASHAGPSETRICHLYSYWNIARQDVAGGTRGHTMAGVIAYLDAARASCDEVLVTFQGKQNAPESPPTWQQFESAFVAFQHLTDPGQPLAAWNGHLSYTAWNEPNNQATAGSGLTAPISPELAAQYYLAARRHCDPHNGCKIASGDFATNGGTANDIIRYCADDNDPANTPTHCAQPSGYNTNGHAPSYLDRYKNYIAVNAASVFGLPAGFRPEYLAYHPWHDVNDYIDNNTPCSTYANCATRRLLESLGGTWGGVEIWDDEIGVGLQNATPPDRNTLQPCGAAFLVQLSELSPRIRRVYFMMLVGTNGPLYDNPTTIRPAGQIMADRATSYAAARCAPTGM